MRKRLGFTLVEVVLVMGIFAILSSFVTVNLLTIRNETSVSAVLSNLVADLKEQQIKAMTGDTEGRSETDTYGIRFETNRYILFHGSTYNPADSSNFVIDMDSDIQISQIGFSGNQVVFAKGSGAVTGFVDGSDFVRVKNILNNQVKTIELNNYGVITDAN